MNTTASASEQTVAQFPIESIVLGRSYRRELGDLTDLTTSIQTLGLLCPIVVTVDNVLISGRRRLEVMRQLGHTTVPESGTLAARPDEKCARIGHANRGFGPSDRARMGHISSYHPLRQGKGL